MKRIFTIVLLLIYASVASSQEEKRVAILPPIDEDNVIKRGVEDLILATLTSAIIDAPGYEAIDRMFLEHTMTEQKFEHSGNVRDDQITELGKLAGADYVLVTTISEIDDEDITTTVRVIEVKSARCIESHPESSGRTRKEVEKMAPRLVNGLKILNPGGTSPNQVTSTPVQQASQPVTSTAVSSSGTNSSMTINLPNGLQVEVASTDESGGAMIYNDAVTACSCKGSGWRLPTVDELKIIAKNTSAYNINNSLKYWSQTKGYGVEMNGGNLNKRTSKASVRCVKDAR